MYIPFLIDKKSTQRVSSIKTRIKTSINNMLRIYVRLREYLPLKQGLRLQSFHLYICNSDLREYLPLKQGLSAN